MFSRRNWLILLLFGFVGQIAWAVENMHFNVFVFDTVSPDLDVVTLMVQLSGIVATLVTLIAGTLSDMVGNRKKFISYGYIIWGITVALFGLMSPSLIANIFSISEDAAIKVTLVLVVVGDCIMTAFGSTANDASFNAWVTDNTTSKMRGKIESVLSVLPLLAMLVVAGGFGIIEQAVGYNTLFVWLGVVITACGLVGILTIKDSPTLVKSGKLKDIFYGFKPQVVKSNVPFYLTLIVIGIYGMACQIFMPYLIIYMKTYLEFSVIEYSVVFGVAIALGAVVNILLGRVVDKFDKIKLLIPSSLGMALGLVGMFFANGMGKMPTLILFGITGFVMITGYILTLALSSALIRDYTPTKDAGKMQGVRMIFSVLIPMVIGPMIGNAINKAEGVLLQDLTSPDIMTTKYIPSKWIFFAGAMVTLLVIVVVPFLRRAVEMSKNGTKTIRLSTDYKIGKIPHSEHPRPQAERKMWKTLNGEWNYRKLNATRRVLSQGTIIVPFSPETLNSTVEEGFKLGEDEKLRYYKKFDYEYFSHEQTFLHFGAVDSFCKVWLNGEMIGTHTCGFTAFSFDVSDVVRLRDNELVIEVRDNAFSMGGARGKQKEKSQGIWYTAQSGIWQSVWLESMPKKFIANLRITPDFNRGQVRINFDYDGKVKLKVYDNGALFCEKETSDGEFVVGGKLQAWTPQNPKLYDFVLCSDSGDELKSYFGLRSFSIEEDCNGKKRIALNGKPYYLSGILDQGYWSDGLLTYPSDKAVEHELMTIKNMGFNCVRKHIKIEPMRWYYHCDRLGLIVWQDFPNGGGNYKFTHIALLPFLGFHHNDDDYKYFARINALGRQEFYDMSEEIVNQLYNCVSVGLYCPFNEGWGQFDSQAVTKWLKELDSSRIYDSVSGWHDQGKDSSDLKSLHTYYTPLRVPKDKRAVVLSEFGGYSKKEKGHVFNENKSFGYKKFKSRESLENALEKLFLEKLMPLIDKGLCASIYTQVSDVEEEINGLITFDRRVQKVPSDLMQSLNEELYECAKKFENVNKK